MRNQRIFFNVTKLKNVSQITNAYKHNTRKACCENADKSKNDNREIIVRDVPYGEFFKDRFSILVFQIIRPWKSNTYSITFITATQLKTKENKKADGISHRLFCNWSIYYKNQCFLRSNVPF